MHDPTDPVGRLLFNVLSADGRFLTFERRTRKPPAPERSVFDAFARQIFVIDRRTGRNVAPPSLMAGSSRHADPALSSNLAFP